MAAAYALYKSIRSELCSRSEEVGRGYDDIQMSHDKYRLQDDIIAYFTFRA